MILKIAGKCGNLRSVVHSNTIFIPRFETEVQCSFTASAMSKGL